MVMDIVAIAFIAFVIHGMCKNDTEVENDGKINKSRRGEAAEDGRSVRSFLR
jgi:hypothetical protein